MHHEIVVRRKWMDDPGTEQNPQGPEFDGLLRPMAWCFKDNCSDDATLLWTRAMGRWQYLDWGGPASFAVTPNYRLLFAGNLDPEWIVKGRLSGWGGLNPYYVTGVHIISPDTITITDVYWVHSATKIGLTFTSQVGINYTIETADADNYDDNLAWTDWTNVTAAADTTTVEDVVTGLRALTEDFRFYRVRVTESDPFYSTQTVGVREIPINAGTTSLYFLSTPLIQHANRKSVREVFGEGANRQVPRTNFTVSDLVESSGAINRMRNAAGVYAVLSGVEFSIEPGNGYEIYVGTGLVNLWKLRLVGYVPEKPVIVPLTKENNQAIRWMGYSMPRTITMSQLGLPGAITPGWNAANRVRVLPLGTSAWITCSYSTATQLWTPNPTLTSGMGLVFSRAGFNNTVDKLIEAPWYFHPPNAW
jgi:hypothetical protein